MSNSTENIWLWDRAFLKEVGGDLATGSMLCGTTPVDHNIAIYFLSPHENIPVKLPARMKATIKSHQRILGQKYAVCVCTLL